jgi:hypothetical protein
MCVNVKNKIGYIISNKLKEILLLYLHSPLGTVQASELVKSPYEKLRDNL